MKTSIIKRLSLKIKTFVATLRRDKYFVNVDEENDFNEATEDIINDNIHNERLVFAVALGFPGFLNLLTPFFATQGGYYVTTILR